MIVWSSVESSCPMCQQRIRVREVGGGFVLGQDSDLLIRMPDKHVIEAEIHTCPHCWFSGYADDFVASQVTEPMVERYFREFAHKLAEVGESDESPDGEDGEDDDRRPFPLPHRQYHFSTLLAPLLGLPPLESGLRMLRAYWCLRLSPSTLLAPRELRALQTLYLRQAIAFLRKSLRRARNPVLVYLVGELCRRNSNFVRAQHYFERFLSNSGPDYLLLAAERLLKLAQGGDAEHRRLEDLLYDDSDTPKRSNRASKKADGSQ